METKEKTDNTNDAEGEEKIIPIEEFIEQKRKIQYDRIAAEVANKYCKRFGNETKAEYKQRKEAFKQQEDGLKRIQAALKRDSFYQDYIAEDAAAKPYIMQKYNQYVSDKIKRAESQEPRH